MGKTFKVIYAKGFRKLQRLIQEKLDEGYILEGGISGSTSVYCQGMSYVPSDEELLKEKEAADAKEAARQKALKEEENAEDEGGIPVAEEVE